REHLRPDKVFRWKSFLGKPFGFLWRNIHLCLSSRGAISDLHRHRLLENHGSFWDRRFYHSLAFSVFFAFWCGVGRVERRALYDGSLSSFTDGRTKLRTRFYGDGSRQFPLYACRKVDLWFSYRSCDHFYSSCKSCVSRSRDACHPPWQRLCASD